MPRLACAARLVYSVSMARTARGAVVWGALASILACACGVEPEPPEVPAAPAARGSFAIHEWGLIEVHAARGPLALATAGAPPDPSPVLGSSYKPVVYVHLRDRESVRFSLSIDVDDVLEVWPRGPGPLRAAWAGVLARGGPCGPHVYPSAEEPCTTADGLCEAPEGASYESSDGACLEVDGRPYDFLLYRARVRRDGLPFDLAGAPESPHVAAREGASVTRLVRVRTGVRGPIEGAAVAERTSTGPLPELTAEPEGAEAIVDALLAGARDAGLSEPEASTFARVWRPSITGPDAPVDAIYYWLDRASVDRVLPMRVDPPPDEVRRAFLVRLVVRVPSGAPAGEALGLAARASRVPRVRIGPPRVRGALSAEVVRRVIQRHVNEVRFCYERALTASPALAGSVEVAFEVEPSGSAASARVTSTTLSDASVESCITGAVGRWTFPAPRGGTVSVDVRFDLDSFE